MTEAIAGGEHPNPSLPTFEAREETALFVFRMYDERSSGEAAKLLASFSLVEDLGTGDMIRSPIHIRGEVLDRTQDDEGHHVIKVLLWGEWTTTADLDWDPPQDFLPDADELERLMNWHETAVQNLEPTQFIRDVRLGDTEDFLLLSAL